MADTIREQIIEAALVQLALIQTVNGYQYDMGAPKRGRKSIDRRDMPVSVVFPGEEDNARRFGKDEMTFPMRIESHIVVGSADPGVLQEKMLGDLRLNMTNPADKWTVLADDVAYLQGGPADQPEAEDKTTAVYIIVSIKYRTNIGNPYTNI